MLLVEITLILLTVNVNVKESEGPGMYQLRQAYCEIPGYISVRVTTEGEKEETLVLYSSCHRGDLVSTRGLEEAPTRWYSPANHNE